MSKWEGWSIAGEELDARMVNKRPTMSRNNQSYCRNKETKKARSRCCPSPSPHVYPSTLSGFSPHVFPHSSYSILHCFFLFSGSCLSLHGFIKSALLKETRGQRGLCPQEASRWLTPRRRTQRPPAGPGAV